MDKSLAFLLVELSTFWGLIPSVIAILVWKKGILEHQLLLILIWGSTFISLLAFLLGVELGLSNLFLLHIYTIFEFILYAFIFRSVLNPVFFKFILFTFPLFAAINSIFFEQLNTMNVLNRSINALLIMFFVLSFFLVNLKEMKILRMEREPLFWVSIGALFYNAASFFIFIFSRDLELYNDLYFTYFGIHSLFTILLYTFYTIALWVQLKQPPTYPSS